MAEPRPNPSEDGFTLVEVLVALVILAVAAAGLVGAAEAHVDSIRRLEDRAAAQWVAENRIVELTVGRDAAPAPRDNVQMLGRTWSVEIAQRPSDDPELQAMTIAVAAEKAPEPLVTMNFFVERPAQ